jgi:hypothetical protein
MAPETHYPVGVQGEEGGEGGEEKGRRSACVCEMKKKSKGKVMGGKEKGTRGQRKDEEELRGTAEWRERERREG